MQEVVKVCKKHGELSIEKIIKYRNPKGLEYYKCRMCSYEVNKRYISSEKGKLARKKVNARYQAKKKMVSMEMSKQ